MTAAEISLAFAREMAGLDTDQECLYENGREIIDHGGIPECVCGWTGRNWDQTEHKKAIPDYANDWNATIAALEQRGMSWGTEYIGGQKYFWVESSSLFESEKGPGPSALCLAAIKCVRESKSNG